MQHVLASYLLERDLAASSVAYYRRCVAVFAAWCERNQSPQLSAQSVSRFLSDMQQLGRSAWYRRSLRNGLVALLRHAGDQGRVRQVKLTTLQPQRWTSTEIARLTAAAACYRCRDATYWPTLIRAAWLTGLNQCDLEQLERRHFAEDGTLRWIRSKTGRQVVVWLPIPLLDARPPAGRLWPRTISREMFRRHFARIVNAAGLTGSFKRLRKSSGTAAEELYPGRGHEHLGNSRVIFERHYLAPDAARHPLRIEER